MFTHGKARGKIARNSIYKVVTTKQRQLDTTSWHSVAMLLRFSFMNQDQ